MGARCCPVAVCAPSYDPTWLLQCCHGHDALCRPPLALDIMHVLSIGEAHALGALLWPTDRLVLLLLLFWLILFLRRVFVQLHGVATAVHRCGSTLARAGWLCGREMDLVLPFFLVKPLA